MKICDDKLITVFIKCFLYNCNYTFYRRFLTDGKAAVNLLLSCGNDYIIVRTLSNVEVDKKN